MSSTIVSLRCPRGELAIALLDLDDHRPPVTAEAPTLLVPLHSRWYPGRYRAVTMRECMQFCLRVGEQTHDHFEFDSSSTVSVSAACASAEKQLLAMHDDDEGGWFTSNDWRFTDVRNPHTIQMRLDAPGSVHATGTTTFSAVHLDWVRDHFWLAEEHNGSYRVRAISDQQAMRIDMPHAFFGIPPTPLLHTPTIYLHERVSDALNVFARPWETPTLHLDGNMLNNTNLNLRPPFNLHANRKRKAGTAGIDSLQSNQPLSGDEDAHIESNTTSPSNSPGGVKKVPRTARTQLNANNRTGVSGVSQSKDGARFQVKVKMEDGSQVRRSFSVLCGAAFTQVHASEDDTRLMSLRMDAFERAADHVATHAPMPTAAAAALV